MIVVAHNAHFDRANSRSVIGRFSKGKTWGCSATEVEWRKRGFEGSRLAYLLKGAGYFHQARKRSIRLWAEQSPCDLKESLKRRGYRWSDGSDGRPRSWYIDVDETKLLDEIAFLKTEINLRDRGATFPDIDSIRSLFAPSMRRGHPNKPSHVQQRGRCDEPEV